tara:strand:- start:571 stop:1296 length:726 start_codon:yes stop_codon:yes gene_type:complete
MKHKIPLNHSNLLKKDGYFSIKSFINKKEIDLAYSGIHKFIKEKNKNVKLVYNYGNSEIRIWNSQILIPELSDIYKKLKFLNNEIFNDSNDFCMLTIINNPCSKNFHKKRWHADSFNYQNKFFLHLTNVEEKDGPFEFIPRTHKLRNKLMRGLRHMNLLSPYFKIKKMRIKSNYSEIDDNYIDSIDGKIKFVCKKGDLLVADVRMLHRDSPCNSGYRVAIHCYLGASPSNFPNSEYSTNNE